MEGKEIPKFFFSSCISFHTYLWRKEKLNGCGKLLTINLKENRCWLYFFFQLSYRFKTKIWENKWIRYNSQIFFFHFKQETSKRCLGWPCLLWGTLGTQKIKTIFKVTSRWKVLQWWGQGFKDLGQGDRMHPFGAVWMPQFIRAGQGQGHGWEWTWVSSLWHPFQFSWQ